MMSNAPHMCRATASDMQDELARPCLAFIITGYPTLPRPLRSGAGCVETAYLFPGIGLGCIVSRANRLRDESFVAAAEALANAVTDGMHLLPGQKLLTLHMH